MNIIQVSVIVSLVCLGIISLILIFKEFFGKPAEAKAPKFRRVTLCNKYKKIIPGVHDFCSTCGSEDREYTVGKYVEGKWEIAGK